MTFCITCQVWAPGHHIQIWADYCPESLCCSGLQSGVSGTLCHRDILEQTHSHQVLHCHQHQVSRKSLQLAYLLTQPSNQPGYIIIWLMMCFNVICRLVVEGCVYLLLFCFVLTFQTAHWWHQSSQIARLFLNVASYCIKSQDTCWNSTINYSQIFKLFLHSSIIVIIFLAYLLLQAPMILRTIQHNTQTRSSLLRWLLPWTDLIHPCHTFWRPIWVSPLVTHWPSCQWPSWTPGQIRVVIEIK